MALWKKPVKKKVVKKTTAKSIGAQSSVQKKPVFPIERILTAEGYKRRLLKEKG